MPFKIFKKVNTLLSPSQTSKFITHIVTNVIAKIFVVIAFFVAIGMIVSNVISFLFKETKYTVDIAIIELNNQKVIKTIKSIKNIDFNVKCHNIKIDDSFNPNLLSKYDIIIINKAKYYEFLRNYNVFYPLFDIKSIEMIKRYQKNNVISNIEYQYISLCSNNNIDVKLENLDQQNIENMVKNNENEIFIGYGRFDKMKYMAMATIINEFIEKSICS